jgi:hypothetical protein
MSLLFKLPCELLVGSLRSFNNILTVGMNLKKRLVPTVLQGVFNRSRRLAALGLMVRTKASGQRNELNLLGVAFGSHAL